MSDKELDNLFKEAAEGFKAPQDSSAWHDMASRLDGAGVTSPAFWNWKSLSTMAVVGVVSVAVISYLVTGDSENTKTEEVISNQSNTSVEPEKAVGNKLTEANPASSQREKTTTVLSSKKASGAKVSDTKQNSNPSANTKAVDFESIEGVDKVTQRGSEQNNSVQVSDEEDSSLSSIPVQVSVQEPQASGNSLGNNIPQNQRHGIDERTAGVLKNSQVMNDSIFKRDDEHTETLLDSAQSTEGKTKSDEKVNKFRPALGVKLAIAPDYTTVKSAAPDRLGVGYGVLLEYRFNEHWSAATGGIWTKKIYTAYDVEYSGYNADWVDGDCRMWDIPVNVYYTFTPGKSFSFYASLGLSSYLMNEENYIYYVETPYGVNDYPQQITGENKEWFKTLNASIGMQLKLNTTLTLQFEPTLKAPLTGVGEGEVSLVSLGAFFNFRFDIPIHKP